MDSQFTVLGSEPQISNNRGAGKGKGMYALVRSSMASWITVVKQSTYCLWLQVKMHLHNQPMDWYIGCCYIPPTSSHHWSPQHTFREALQEIQIDVVGYQEQGNVLLCGDFNGRTQTHDGTPGSPDVDSICEHFCIPSVRYSCVDWTKTRNSCDVAPACQQGKALIESLCTQAGLWLLNGRCSGDHEGAFTCTTHRAGCISRSVIDYALCCSNAAKHISRFVVLDALPNSDHNPLSVCLQVPSLTPSTPEGVAPTQFPKWRANRKREYTLSLAAEPAQEHLKQICDAVLCGEMTVEMGTGRLVEVIKGCADNVFGKSPNRMPSGRRCKTWFSHCKQEWSVLKQAIQSGDTHAANAARKSFKQISRRWKRFYSVQHQNYLLDALKNNPRKFWRYFKGSRYQRATHKLAELTEYWSGLLSPNNCGALCENYSDLQHLTATLHNISGSSLMHEAASCLNTPIDISEISAALESMKLGKAAGPDGLSIEFLKEAYWFEGDGQWRVKRFVFAEVLHVLCGAAFNSGKVPNSWCAASISAVHKKGSTHDLGNYRPIAVSAVIGKLLSKVLEMRLDIFAEEHGIRAKGQAGFRKGRNTIDQLFVLQHLVEKHQIPKGAKHLYCCFVDFQKAYDGVNRDVLFRHLSSLGLHGCFLQTVASMYWNVPLQAKCNGRLGTSFQSTSGVKQGDPLSPLLFGLLIDSLEQHMQATCPGVGVLIRQQLLQVLLYADDLVLFAESPESLQQQLDALHTFCLQKHLTVNIDKTEVVVFGRKRYQGGFCWMYNNRAVQVSPTFKYLGLIFHETKGVSTCVDALKSSANRAMHCLISRLRNRGILDVHMRLHLFSSLVLPITTYGCQVWAPQVLSSKGGIMKGMFVNPLQQIQSHYLRHVTGMPKHTPIPILSHETGCLPVACQWIKLCARFWNKLSKMEDSEWPKAALLENMELARLCSNRSRRRMWYTTFLDMVNACTPGAAPISAGVPIDEADLCQGINAVVVAQFQGLECDPRKLDVNHRSLVTYVQWFCDDLLSSPPVDMRSVKQLSACAFKCLLQFRAGADWLNVNKGRSTQTPYGARLCLKCNNCQVEDAHHFVFECPQYDDIRLKHSCLFSAFGGVVSNGQHKYNSGMLRTFMAQDNAAVGRFIHSCWKLRKNLENQVPYFTDIGLDLLDSDED